MTGEGSGERAKAALAEAIKELRVRVVSLDVQYRQNPDDKEAFKLKK